MVGNEGSGVDIFGLIGEKPESMVVFTFADNQRAAFTMGYQNVSPVQVLTLLDDQLRERPATKVTVVPWEEGMPSFFLIRARVAEGVRETKAWRCGVCDLQIRAACHWGCIEIAPAIQAMVAQGAAAAIQRRATEAAAREAAEAASRGNGTVAELRGRRLVSLPGGSGLFVPASGG